MNTIKQCLVITLICLCLLQTARAESPLTIDSAWIREAPPTSTVLAAYMNVQNDGASDQQITGMSSPDFRAAEIHRTVVEDGVAKMQPVAGLDIKAGELVNLEPGGLHVMLFDPQGPLREGDSATLIIHLADGTNVSVSAKVRRMTGDDGGHDHSHHHH